MYLKFENFKIKNFQRGITLIEILVVIAIIVILMMILVVDLPKIQRQYAISKAIHELAQNVRKAEDLALSGLETTNSDSSIIAKGYGIFINLATPEQYILYADIDGDKAYDALADLPVDVINFADEAPGVQIAGFDENIEDGVQSISINFNPPNPAVTILGLKDGSTRVGITLSLKSDTDSQRFIYVYTSGLIETK